MACKKRTLSSSEALFGFMAWLTSRKEILTIGATEDCAPFPELIKEFCERNNLVEPVDGWEKILKHPSGERF